MKKILKTVPMHHEGKVIYLTIVKESIPEENQTKGFDTNFQVIPLDENVKPLPCPEDDREAYNLIHFLLCKYLWNTSQPTQWVKEMEGKSPIKRAVEDA